jgi:hypothetical protein
MISDREIWQCALLMVKRYNEDARHGSRIDLWSNISS